MPALEYRQEPGLLAADYIALLNDSGLGARRPVDDPDRIERMLRGSSMVVTARLEGMLVGAARALSDFSYCCYLADLAVSRNCQGQGIGQGLIAEVRRLAGEESMCLLLAAPDAVGFYEHIGMPHAANAFLYPRGK